MCMTHLQFLRALNSSLKSWSEEEEMRGSAQTMHVLFSSSRSLRRFSLASSSFTNYCTNSRSWCIRISSYRSRSCSITIACYSCFNFSCSFLSLSVNCRISSSVSSCSFSAWVNSFCTCALTGGSSSNRPGWGVVPSLSHCSFK